MSSSGLFKKFSLESVTQLASTKASDQRRVRQQLTDQFPDMTEEYWENVLPKKSDVMIVKCTDQVNIVTLATSQPEPLFFQHHDGDFIPTLRLLHKYPFLLPQRHKVDIGGCKYVISGANVMCPGLTSAGGSVGDNIPNGSIVAIMIEGKKHAVAIGKTTMSSADILSKNKGICIETVHYLGDGLWMTPILSSSAQPAKTEE